MNVRVDGIAAVLGPLVRDAHVAAAALVDVDSGMVLDAWCAEGIADAPDLELLGAQHAEVVRGALALQLAWPGPATDDDGCEVVLGPDGGRRHLLRTVPDRHGDRLALAVVVDGSARVLERVRKRLRSVSVDALTAGPSVSRRPVLGGWSFAMPGPDVPARPGPLHEALNVPAPAEPVPAPPPVPAAAHPLTGPVPALSRLDAGPVAPYVPPPSPAPAPSPRPHAVRREPAAEPATTPSLPRPPSPPAALPAPAPRQG